MEINYWYIITGMATSFLLCTALLMFYLKYRKNIIQQQYQLKVAELNHQKELLHSVISTQENERKRIAVAVHDDIGNSLNILILLLNRLELNNDELKNGIISQALKITDATRNISHSLYPVNIDELGLILYIEELISILSDKIVVSFHINQFPKKNSFVEVQLFRIIQEFTTNVLKHSTASEIEIWIKGGEHTIYLILSDNGCSFDYNTITKGMGLKNIESRINSLNGTFKWKNVKDRGSRLIVRI
ncbi:sensor histidine kinase [Empedobacter brevis]|uniref:sensor histidine kinase n=1 Tax=Empedobacter brevis TaxID=247 RepID=UPI001F3F8571|nr:ATP-binding protein [Empedobacter brevis]